MTRHDFESLSSSDQKKYAEKRYAEVRKELADDMHDVGIFNCEICGVDRWSHFHHLWERSHCSLWWYFQPENLIAVGYCCHPRLVHDAPYRLTKAQRDTLRQGRDYVIQLDNEYKKSQAMALQG